MAGKGQPTKFKAEYIKQAEVACKNFGSTDLELAELFDVCEDTIYNWKKEHLDFFEAIKRGKEEYDTSRVVVALRERATGYSHDDVHISNFQGEITETEITKHYPPDPTSMIFWLKNRDPNRWRDKVDVGVTKKYEDMTDEEIDAQIKRLKEQTGKD
jgi:hypothetical protein